VNLFIAIVINNLEAAKREERAEAHAEAEQIAERLADIRGKLSDVEDTLRNRALRAGPPVP
jgi:rRNA-processing protein FCF1